MRIQIFDVVAVGDPDKEGVIDEHGVDLYVDVQFNEPAVLFVGVGDEMHSGNISEGCLVVGVDFVNFEPILKQFTVHQLPIIIVNLFS